MRFTNLEVLRRRAGLTQTALGRRVGCAGPYLSVIESGQRRPSAALLDRLAAELGGDAATLLADPFNEREPRITARLPETFTSTNHSPVNLDA